MCRFADAASTPPRRPRIRSARTSIAAALAATVLAGAIAAQRMPVPGNDGRELQLVDLRPLAVADDFRESDAAGPADPAGKAALAAVLAGDEPGEALVPFLRAFVEPPMQDDEHLARLGSHLAVLGRAEQCEWVSRLVADVTRAGDLVLDFEVQLIQLEAGAYKERLLPFLQAGGDLDEDDTTAHRTAADADIADVVRQLQQDRRAKALMAPRLRSRPLQRCSVEVGDVVAFVRDYAVLQGPRGAIGNPVVDSVFDGTRLAVRGVPIGEEIAVTLGLQHAVVQRPLVECEVDIGLPKDVKLQLPRAQQVQLQQRALLQPGHGLVVAGRQPSGSWLLAALTVRRLSQR